MLKISKNIYSANHSSTSSSQQDVTIIIQFNICGSEHHAL